MRYILLVCLLALAIILGSCATEVKLYSSGNVVLVSISPEVRVRAISALANPNSIVGLATFGALVSTEQVISVSNGTKAQLLESQADYRKVKILEGNRKDWVGWVVSENIR